MTQIFQIQINTQPKQWKYIYFLTIKRFDKIHKMLALFGCLFLGPMAANVSRLEIDVIEKHATNTL